MAYPVTRRVRRAQPSPGEALAIDWLNPITRDMVFVASNADAGYGFCVGGASVFPLTGGAQRNTPQGTGAFSSGTASIFNVAGHGLTTTNYSLFAFGTCNSSTVTQNALDMDNAAPRYFQFRLNSGKVEFIPFNTSAAVTGQCTASTALSVSEMVRGFTMGATASPTRTACFQNGVLAATATPSNLIAPSNGQALAVGARATNTAGWWNSGALMLTVAWNRTLSDAEMTSLNDNPWQLFKPVPRRLYLAWSASTGTTIAANTGAVSIAGLPATISAATIISAAVASTLVQGQAAQIVTPANIAASTGMVSVAGQSAQVVTPVVINATAAGAAVAGLPAQVVTPTNIACGATAVSVQGQAAAVSSGNGISCTKAAVTVAGQPASITTSVAINCATGSVSAQGMPASVSAVTNIACSMAHVAVEGMTATITVPTDIATGAGSVIVQGQRADIVTQDGIACSTATVVVIGLSATITGGVEPLAPNPHRTYMARPRIRAYVGQKRVRTL